MFVRRILLLEYKTPDNTNLLAQFQIKFIFCKNLSTSPLQISQLIQHKYSQQTQSFSNYITTHMQDIHSSNLLMLLLIYETDYLNHTLMLLFII